ncbi:conserved hypothetical protein [Denitrovibrio acetiphilus DSM 12809]|uniref:Uncharacterized protein n=1 Tax=Denitrovibrio acetiphilus (strain DSM 12809 / NBRC 114555 / N2460) TaxID=522772 RepID=D4H5J0_DENA2|nr:hypothetical protein [Denitrovibrio acetiphilus]ADD67610.1 conserved hypothetical protein [Denitrovibrio acetiphilus DSM 12809]
MAMIKDLKENYTPVYFLASLGAGGLTVSFFIYFMFMLDHPGLPVATFDIIYPVLTGENPAISAMIALTYAAMLFFFYMHIRLLIWNIIEYRKFRKTTKYHEMKNSHQAVAFMAIPLTLAMTVNCSFAFFAAVVPNLWSIVEYMFPGAILAFAAIGIYAMKIFVSYFTDFMIKGEFDYAKNNNLSQMLGIFAFSMVAVGFAAPAAMTHIKAVSAISLFLSIFFLVLAMSLTFVKITLGLKSIFRYGISKEGSATLWIAIPILTIVGITMIRMFFGLSHNFDSEGNPSVLFVFTSVIVSLQAAFGVIGYVVMKRIGYFKDYLYGTEKSASIYSLICPGVAVFVFGMFFIFYGLIKNGLVERFSTAYFMVMLPFTVIQLKTAWTMLRINRKMLKA